MNTTSFEHSLYAQSQKKIEDNEMMETVCKYFMLTEVSTDKWEPCLANKCIKKYELVYNSGWRNSRFEIYKFNIFSTVSVDKFILRTVQVKRIELSGGILSLSRRYQINITRQGKCWSLKIQLMSRFQVHGIFNWNNCCPIALSDIKT